LGRIGCAARLIEGLFESETPFLSNFAELSVSIDSAPNAADIYHFFRGT
jgi:hypothetical protein